MSEEKTPKEKADEMLLAQRKEDAKRYTKSLLQPLTEADRHPVELYSSGSLVLNLLLGAGGLPRRGISQFYGPPKQGKSTMAIACLADNSRRGLRCEYHDFEGKMDYPFFLRTFLAMGGDANLADFYTHTSSKDGMEMMNAHVGLVPVQVLDSIGKLQPTKIEQMKGRDGVEHTYMGAQSTLVKLWVEAITGDLRLSGIAGKLPLASGILCVNQVRADFSGFGDGFRYPGGWAYAHALWVSVKVAHGKLKTKEDKTKMKRTRFLVTESVIGYPNVEATIPLIFGHGINLPVDTLDPGVTTGVIEVTGNNVYSINGDQLDQGRPRTLKALAAMPRDELFALRDKIQDEIVRLGKDRDYVFDFQPQ